MYFLLFSSPRVLEYKEKQKNESRLRRIEQAQASVLFFLKSSDGFHQYETKSDILLERTPTKRISCAFGGSGFNSGTIFEKGKLQTRMCRSGMNHSHFCLQRQYSAMHCELDIGATVMHKLRWGPALGSLYEGPPKQQFMFFFSKLLGVAGSRRQQ